jgi:hypothetical protein
MSIMKNPHKLGDSKSQSAIEYLMTYGWVILVIAGVLVVLFILGVFNPNFWAPKMLPESCQVLRPNGPGTTASIALIGTCNFEEPQFVYQGAPGSYIMIANSADPASLLNVENSITITAWVYVYSGSSQWHDVVDKEHQYGMKLDYNNIPHQCTPTNNPSWCLEWDTSNDWTGYSYPIPAGAFDQWMFIAVSAAPTGPDQTTKYWYANGAYLGDEVVSGYLSYANNALMIGTISPGSTGIPAYEWFGGQISNVQLYNTSLSQSSIKTLYLEGIGGAPIDLRNLVGWWPLDGNGLDYSGNGYDAAMTNSITFNGGSWWEEYSPPS